jgi:hypothetical protein
MEGSADDRQVLDELSMLADDLLQQATEIRRQWSELAEVLGAELPDLPPLEQPPEPRAPRPAVAGPDEPVPPAQQATPPPQEADPVRLVALDMMLSGRSRAEVKDYLNATFGDGDREDVLDEIFTQYG